LEVVLALAVFGMAATGFAVAMSRMGQAATMVQKELQITRIMESTLDETLSLPVLEEGLTSIRLENLGMDLDTEIEILDELENENGQLLQEMFRITVTATWFDSGQWQERMVETWRYGRLYQP
jgi:type II secretory pathway pseudopilin PulG